MNAQSTYVYQYGRGGDFDGEDSNPVIVIDFDPDTNEICFTFEETGKTVYGIVANRMLTHLWGKDTPENWDSFSTKTWCGC